MTTNIQFPQGPIADTTGYVTLEWLEWFQNPQFISFTLPAVLDVTSGGTGLAAYTTGDFLYASSHTTIAGLHDVAVGNVLLSGGVGVAPAYGKVDLTAHITGTLPVANGGTGATTSTGSGSVVLSSGPVLTTPTLGAATGTTLSLSSFIRPGTAAGAAQTASGLFAGTGAPSNTDGQNGDFYFRSDGGALTTIYQRRAGAWVGIV